MKMNVCAKKIQIYIFKHKESPKINIYCDFFLVCSVKKDMVVNLCGVKNKHLRENFVNLLIFILYEK